jgi:hypothetical protein
MLKSLTRQWTTALGLLAANILVWTAFRFTVFQSFKPPDLWQAQMALAQGLLLVDTLLVIWWYTDRTAALCRTSQQQFGHAVGVERIRQKPFVVANRLELQRDGYGYFIRNIGEGLAVNVWYVEEQSDGAFLKQPLGALGSDDSKRLPADVDRRLCDQDGLFPFALAAEGLITRTAQ